MRFATLAALTVSALGASAQTTHTIFVGAGHNNTYFPPTVSAAIGDFVSFVFTSKNHTVSQSTFAAPCTQFTNTSIADPTKQNLTSGFMFVPANATSLPVWTIQVTQTTPLWFYCQQTGHCEQGMVGAINPPNDTAPNSFQNFQNKAMSLGTGSVTTSITSALSSTGSASPTASASTTSKASDAMKAMGGVSSGATATVAMGMVGVILGLVL